MNAAATYQTVEKAGVRVAVLSPATVEKIKHALGRFPKPLSAVLPAFHAVHEQFGYLDEPMYEAIAEVLGVTRAEVAEAATFYTLFPKQPVGKNLIMVCKNISCALRGADNLISYLEKRLGIKVGETTPDGKFTIWKVECLGSCGTAPMMQVNDQFHENLTRGKVDALLEKLAK
ncbi:MAG: NADH-quinone oxidoreductase subunit NuoE [candidate division Zixibacteria bacterium]|nr:NADH-quinone oxidoreductase subunit NuoE [candidate division Zixibacteria bacterium]